MLGRHGQTVAALPRYQTEMDPVFAVAAGPPRSVALSRVTDYPTNREFTAIWRLRRAGGTQITLQLSAELRVAASVPADGIADETFRAFVAAAPRALAVSFHVGCESIPPEVDSGSDIPQLSTQEEWRD